MQTENVTYQGRETWQTSFKVSIEAVLYELILLPEKNVHKEQNKTTSELRQ